LKVHETDGLDIEFSTPELAM